MGSVIDGLAVRGNLIVVGLSAEAIEVAPLQLIGAGRTVVGHSSGTSQDSEDTMRFSTQSNPANDGDGAT